MVCVASLTLTPDIARANDTAPGTQAQNTPAAQAEAPADPELGALVQQTAVQDRSAATRGAGAAAAPEMLDTYDRNAVLTAFVNQHDTLPTGSEVWSGNQTQCNAGDAPAHTRAGVLRRVNFFRAMAGVPSAVTLNAAYNAKAQQAALLMSANGKLSACASQRLEVLQRRWRASRRKLGSGPRRQRAQHSRSVYPGLRQRERPGRAPALAAISPDAANGCG